MTSKPDDVRLLGHIPGRSKKYLRTSLIVLAGAFALLGAVVLYVERGYAEQERNFDDNTNLLLITVTHREGENSAYDPLSSRDRTDIELLLAADSHAATASAAISNRYSLGGGVTSSSGEPFFIYGIDSQLAEIIGVPRLEDGHGYLPRDPGTALETAASTPDVISIPVVSIEPEGYTSGALADYPLLIDRTADAHRIEYLVGGDVSNVMFVSTSTFENLAEAMFMSDWQTIRTRWEAGELPMTPLVSSVYVKVDDLDGVRRVANALEEGGYGTSYGLRAFDDIESSLRTSTILAALTVVAAIGAAGTLFILSWRSYLALSRRDIGILKHWGVPSNMIVAGYVTRLTRTCVMAASCGIMSVLVLAPLFLDGSPAIFWSIANAAGIAVVAAAVHQLILHTVIKPRVATDVLVLLRENREFQ